MTEPASHLTPPSKKLVANFNLTNLILAAGLLCILIPLFGFHYNSKRLETQASIRNQVQERTETLENFIQQTKLYVQQLHGSMQFQLQHPVPPDPLQLPLLPLQHEGYFSLDHLENYEGYQSDEVGNVFGKGDLSNFLSQKRFNELRAAQGLFSIFRSGHQAMPELAWSYYQSAHDFAAIYPWQTTKALIEQQQHENVEHLLHNVLQMDFFRLGHPTNNPTGSSYWTPTYQDPAGQGLMITHAIPLSHDGHFYGIVAADITIAHLQSYVRHLRSNEEYFAIFDPENNLLVANNPLSDIVDLPFQVNITAQEGAQLREGDVYTTVSTQLSNAPFRILYAIPNYQVSPLYSREFITYTAANLLFLSLILLSYLLLKRRMIDPALALTDHIRNEAAHGKSHLEEVPEVWRPWFREVSDTLALKAVSANLPGAILQFRRHPDGTVQNIFVSDAVYDITGMTPEVLKADVRNWDQMVDRETNREIGKVLNNAALNASPMQHEYKITTPQGQEKWLRFSANPRRDSEGFCMFEGLLLDITEIKKAELALRASEARLRSILETAPFALVISSLENGFVVFINPKGAQLFGISSLDVLGHEGNKTWHDASIREKIFEQVGKGETIEDYEVKLNRCSGEAFWATLSATPFEYLGERCILFTYNDITNRKHLEEELKYLATTDPLTGALNRRAFMERGNFELARNKRYGGKLGVILLDVDFFKQVNDTHGHAFGDVVLKQLVAKIQHTLRETDIIGRLGGEEFAAILPETHSNEAKATAERLCRAIRTTPVDNGNQTITVTISIGVTEQLQTDEKLDQLLVRADKALYQAKDQGRDRVVYYKSNDKVIQELNPT